MIFKLLNEPYYYIYAHLNPATMLPEGTEVKQGDIVAEIGTPHHNGGWYEHLHVQCLVGDLPETFDGYGKGDYSELHRYPNPEWLVPDAEHDFERLNHVWKCETGFSSRIMTEHWAYQRVATYGPEMVPVLLRKMRDDPPGWWFSALKDLTGAWPCNKDNAGRFLALAKEWVAWGRQNGYDI